MADCKHRWRRLYEESLIGGCYPIGWECVLCGKYFDNAAVTPTGLPGLTLKKAARLVGPHGGCGSTSGGVPYQEQVVDEAGNLTIVPVS